MDYAVIGEGEQTILALLDAIAAGDDAAFDRIAGLARRIDGHPRATPCAPPLEDLDHLPNPAHYFTYQHVSLTRGCPGACRFCGSPAIWGRKVRFHSAGYFVDQLELLARQGVRFFYFADDTFTLRRDLVIAVCKEILARRLTIQWTAISRVDTVD